MSYKSLCIVSFLLLIPVISFSQGNPNFNGQWTLLPEKSSEIGLYRTLSIEIQQKNDDLTLIQKWGAGRSFSDTLHLKTDNKFSNFSIPDRVFPTNVFMGLSMNVRKNRKIKYLSAFLAFIALVFGANTVLFGAKDQEVQDASPGRTMARQALKNNGHWSTVDHSKLKDHNSISIPNL